MPPLVLRNNAISIQELRSLIRDGAYDNVVISPGPGTPLRKEDVGGLPVPVEEDCCETEKSSMRFGGRA